jgi:hypothetical protein
MGCHQSREASSSSLKEHEEICGRYLSKPKLRQLCRDKYIKGRFTDAEYQKYLKMSVPERRAFEDKVFTISVGAIGMWGCARLTLSSCRPSSRSII